MTTIKCGFDKTAFETHGSGWQDILDICKLEFSKELDNEKGFLWLGQHLKVVTGDNPLTGMSRIKVLNHRNNIAKGWAGYIGIEGTPEAVLEFVGQVFLKATVVKNFDPKMDSYIGV